MHPEDPTGINHRFTASHERKIDELVKDVERIKNCIFGDAEDSSLSLRARVKELETGEKRRQNLKQNISIGLGVVTIIALIVNIIF